MRRSVILGIQGAQSTANFERGIARYVTDHALALAQRAPEFIAEVGLDRSLRLPNSIERILDKLDFGFNDRAPATPSRPLVYHVMSPFEPVALERIWPRWAQDREVGLVVTLHDLIPLLFSDRYLHNSEARSWYHGRMEMLRVADAVLAISQSTARDAVEHLGVDPRRVFTIYEDCSSFFRPSQVPPEALLHDLQAVLPDLRPDYFFYVGGIDFRKNVEGMIAAYALLPPEVQTRHQLVISCKVLPDEERVLRDLAAARGLTGELLLTGYVSDDVLVRLYQGCGLFVFPSLYEGFGLPVLEAMRCGAPVIAGDVSSLRELVRDPEARFDPTSPITLRDRMQRGVEDLEFRSRLRAVAVSESQRFTWDKVVEETLRGYRFAHGERSRPSAPRRFRLAFFSPWPPQESGVADYSFRLVQELARHCDVDVFVDGEPAAYTAPAGPGVRLCNGRDFELLRLIERYDRLLYCMGNSAVHEYLWWVLTRYRGDVLMHDLRLTGFYSWVGQHGRVRRDFLHQKLREMYGSRLPPELKDPNLISLSPDQARRYGVFMAREVIEKADRVFLHSEAARRIALLDSGREGSFAAVIPFGHPDLDPAPIPDGPPVVASFGIVDEIKQASLLIRAVPELSRLLPEVKLVFAGHMYPDQGEGFRRLAKELGVDTQVVFTGRISAAEYARRLQSAQVAVQLRAVSTGESSASVADCLAAGLPTVVSDIGALGELPRDAVVHVPVEVDPTDLARVIAGLLDDRTRSHELRRRAREYAQANSFAQAADRLSEHLSSAHQGTGEEGASELLTAARP